MSSVSKLAISVEEWPTRNDLLEFLHQPNAQEEVQRFLTEEFDTLVHFRLGENDLLGGYPEAFFLPLHAFALSLSRGLRMLEKESKASLPIYLQQYQINEGDPAHTMTWEVAGKDLKVSFEWGGQSSAPATIEAFDVLLVEGDMFRREVTRFLDVYMRKILMLVGSLSGWSEKQVAALFADF